MGDVHVSPARAEIDIKSLRIQASQAITDPEGGRFQDMTTNLIGDALFACISCFVWPC